MTNFVAVFTTAADRNAVIAELTRLREENARLREALENYNHAIDLAATAKGARKVKISGLNLTPQELATKTLRHARLAANKALAS